MHISEIIKTPKVVVTHKTEYGELQDYFVQLNMKDRNGRLLSRGAIGFLLMPFVRGKKDNRDYGLLYALKDKCQKSNNPQATFWTHTRPKRK